MVALAVGVGVVEGWKLFRLLLLLLLPLLLLLLVFVLHPAALAVAVVVFINDDDVVFIVVNRYICCCYCCFKAYFWSLENASLPIRAEPIFSKVCHPNDVFFDLLNFSLFIYDRFFQFLRQLVHARHFYCHRLSVRLITISRRLNSQMTFRQILSDNRCRNSPEYATDLVVSLMIKRSWFESSHCVPDWCSRITSKGSLSKGLL